MENHFRKSFRSPGSGLALSVSATFHKSGKRKKSAKQRDKFVIELQPTTDILASVASADRNFFVVGFAAETHELEERALKKLRAKNCDMIVANDVSRSDSGMESDENEVVIFTRDGESQRVVRAQKKIIARKLVKKICAEVKKVLTKKS